MFISVYLNLVTIFNKKYLRTEMFCSNIIKEIYSYLFKN